MADVVANLYQTDRGVKILVIEDSENFFKIEGVPFRNSIEGKIKHLEVLSGDIKPVVITTKPDVVIAHDVNMTEGSVEMEIHSMKVVKKGKTELIKNKVVVSGCVEVGSNVLCELNGHVFFALKSEGHECTYSQYLFIDQLRSLKAKLNID